MNRKQLILLLVVLAVLGSAGLALLHRNKDSWAVPEAKMGDKVLPNFRFNEVAAIHIHGATDLNVVRTNGIWRVVEHAGYPANFHQISELLIKIRDLKVVQSESIGPAQLARVNLEEPGKGSGSGTLVEFQDSQGKVLDALLLGKKHIPEPNESRRSAMGNAGSPDGRYILLRNDPKNVLLISDALATLEPIPQQWMSRDFFKVEKMKSIAFVSTNAANSWKLARETEAALLSLVDARPGEALDTNQAISIAISLVYPIFVDVALGTDSAQTGLDQPKVLTVESFDHFTYTLKIGSKSAEGRYYMTVAVSADIPTERIPGKDEKPDEKKKLDQEFQNQTKQLQDRLKQEQSLAPWIYQINSWIIDPLIRDRAQILEKH